MTTLASGLNGPAGVTVTPDGDVVVANYYGNTVVTVSSSGLSLWNCTECYSVMTVRVVFVNVQEL